MAKATKTADPKEQTPEEQIEALNAVIAEKDAQIDSLSAINEALQAQIEENEQPAAEEVKKEKKKPVIPSKSFKVDGVEHVFTVPQFTNPMAGHAVITAEEAITNKELCEYLVNKDCGVTERKGKK